MKKLILMTACLTVMLVSTMSATAQNTTNQKTAIVRTMGHNALTPLPPSPVNLLPQAAPTRKQMPSNIPVVAADYKMPAQIYGLLVYSSAWTNGSGKGKYGVYTFTADKPNSMTAAIRDDAFAANGGAIYANGKLNVLNYTDLWGVVILDYDYYQYSTQYWDLLQHVHEDDVTRLMSACGGFDATNGKYYAIMYSDDMSSQMFGTIDYAHNSRTILRTLAAEENVLAMAISPEGVIYGIRTDGKLVKINKSNGQMTVVGPTGITPLYMQSAAIDPRTGRMFWAACSTTDPVGLYEVNLETGQATLIEKFKNNEEFVGLYIPSPLAAEDAPAAPTSLSASFNADELTGTINFRLPKTTFAGDDISTATLGYRVYLDGTLAAEGTGEAGTVVRPEVSVGESKMCRFEVCATNNAGEGPRIHLDKWVGKDAPTAPTNVRMVKTGDNTIKLTWSAPTSGIHKGYVDKAALNYTVTRMPGNVVVAEKLTERVFTETLDVTQMANYYYVVTAFNGDIEGETGESNRMTFGSAIETPFFEDFEDLTVVPNMFTFVDANKDGVTWRSGKWNGNGNSDVYYQLNEDGKTKADDWLFTPPIHMKAGRFYTLSFDTQCYFLGIEKMSAWMGTDKTVAAMTTELVPTMVVENTDMKTTNVLIKSDKDDICYFGFHAESDADQGILELDNLRLEENGVFEAPDTVTNLVIEPGKSGNRTARITFTAPTTNFFGDEISEIEKIEIYRGKTLRKTFENTAPGSDLLFNDSSVPNGDNTYYIYTYNSYGCGIPAERTVWVGVDIPTEPTDVTLTVNGTQAKLTWKAPTTGVHGGYINASAITYNIEDMNFYIKADHRAGTTYTETRGSQQELLSYRVSAQNSAGGGNYANSNVALCGLPYKLPFHESFANAKTDQFWSSQLTGGEIGLTQSISADGDQGAALYKPAKVGDRGILTSGMINIKTVDHPILEFYYYALPKQNMTLSIGVVPDGDGDRLQVVHTIDYSKLSGNEGWRKATVSLDGFSDTKNVLLAFIGTVTGTRFGDIAFDAITVRNQDDIDLAMQSLTLPSTAEAGSTVKASAVVYNNGRLSVSDYRVRLTKNGSFVAESNGTEIASGKYANFTFDIPTTVTDQTENTFEVSIICNGDADDSNNTAQAKLLIDMPVFPTPTNVQGSVDDDDQIQLSWTAPNLSPRDIIVTDGFERYTPFSIDGIGQWTVRDVDGQLTGSLQDGSGNTIMYDHVGEPMAFQVFNTEAAGLGTVEALLPYSGSQMLANIIEVNGEAADDWLISPELSGHEQTVSFWVRSIYDGYIESFTVLASQGGTDVKDFTAVEASVSQAPARWTEVTAQLPEGTRHFAIRVKGSQKFMLLLDDISYARFNTADLKLLGYNIYWADERLNETPVTTTTYTCDYLGDGLYYVSAVYEQGESALSQPVNITTGIQVNSPTVQHFNSSTVYDLQGRKLSNGQLSNSQMRKGIYIQNGKKVVIK